MNVVKANGEIAAFDPGKIRRSLARLKINPAWIEQVIENISSEIYDLIPTSELYKIVFDELKKLQKGVAAKYNLKRAIMDLGPTGFPFEKFIAALFQSEGFATQTGQIIKGYCVNHEIDVIAEHGNLFYLMECKFHGFAGKVSDLKTALYVYARFLDVEKSLKALPLHRDKIHKMWLVTNVRFTEDAIDYGTCAGLELMSWDFPAGTSLSERIDRSGLHPVTCLTMLTKKEKEFLLRKNIVLGKDLAERPEVLSEIGIRDERISKIADEAEAICLGVF
jgi:hypothetical protein